MSKRGEWLRPAGKRKLASNAWLLIIGLDEPYRRGAIEIWWERCERVLKAEHPELMNRNRTES